MKRMIAVAMFTLFTSPYLYGMKRVRSQEKNTDLELKKVYSEQLTMFGDTYRREIIFEGFTRRMKLKELMSAENLTHFRHMYVNNGQISDNLNGRLLKQYVVEWYHNIHEGKKTDGPRLYTFDGQVFFK